MPIPAACVPPAIPRTAGFGEHWSAVCAGWPGRSFVFGAFVLQPERQLLSREGRPVRIGGRALDLLTALVERPGQLLSKTELIAKAWPGIFVDHANLKVNVATLRRVLGERVDQPRFIATVIGRGYRFVAPVRLVAPEGDIQQRADFAPTLAVAPSAVATHFGDAGRAPPFEAAARDHGAYRSR